MEEEFYIYKVTSTQELKDRAKGRRASFYGGKERERERSKDKLRGSAPSQDGGQAGR